MSATIAPAPLLDDEDEGRSRGRGRLLVLLAVLVGVAVGAGWFLLLGPGAAAAEAEAPGGEVTEGAVLELPPLTTTTGTATLRHARVALGLVLTEGADETAITARAPLLQDALLREIATMDADHLRSSTGSDQLRGNLTEHAQTIWPDGEVIRIVLTELLVQ
jgi:flagellar protein FliL